MGKNAAFWEVEEKEHVGPFFWDLCIPLAPFPYFKEKYPIFDWQT
jgi:hypothetical protein